MTTTSLPSAKSEAALARLSIELLKGGILLEGKVASKYKISSSRSLAEEQIPYSVELFHAITTFRL
eukprot:CAMPEP_0197447612 /NCGR_PEP_ID=MMETSP1175-20131217/14035_1 /TAXON_ID=1003142 /ORGANISM="Triceratium dubium, Strain CCMP147" /LENGTH=65 /DNA_ID=CAMNT_0042979005 /DNA_START=79 /DNA_END=276 /DNA_ORIENTATION=+